MSAQKKMVVIPLDIAEAFAFLKSRGQIFRLPDHVSFVLGLEDINGQLHGCAIVGHLSGEEAELSHVYADGSPEGFTKLYGQAVRASKAIGYRKLVL